MGWKRFTSVLAALTLVVGISRSARATDEFPPGGFAVGKLKLGQASATGKDGVTVPGSSANFFDLTSTQASSLAGANVTLKVNDYCRTFGPLVSKTGAGPGAKKKFQVKETASSGERITATFAEGAQALRFKTSIAIKRTDHGFPTGTFPRKAPKPGDPATLAATLVVGNVGGTFDTLTGQRLPFVDPGQQAASEELPDRQAIDLQDVWTFHGKAGDEVSFRVDTAGTGASGLDLAAELIAPDGQTVLKKADDEVACSVATVCGYGCPEVLNYVLPSTGTYAIVVHDFGATDDGCDTGGTYRLTISEPACTAATLAEDDDLLLAVCGDDQIGPGEQCEQATDCDADELCDGQCQCASLCGNGTVDAGEQCEDASQCAAGEICAGCACETPAPLGTRSFTLDPQCSFLDTTLSPIHPAGRAAATALTLEAGPPDESGVAPVALTAPVFVGINISLISSTICSRIGPCTGELYCDGGANVDVTTEIDSLANGLTCNQTGVACLNACEGSGSGNSGNPLMITNDPGALPAGPAGSMLLQCQQAVTTVAGLNASCATATYGAGSTLTYTTGKSLSRVLNHCPGGTAPAGSVPSFQGQGAAFSCDAWTTTNGPGRLVLAVPAEEPNTSFPGDGANLFSLCDAP